MLTLPPLDGAVGAAATAVAGLAAAAAPLAGANATALAIVGLTALVRLAVSPLSVIQARSERRRNALLPRLRELQRRHRRDPDRLRAETVALYRAERVNPLGGCLPALLQAPFFLVMYRLATSPPAASNLLAESLFGVPLGHHLGDGLAGAAGPVFGVLLLLLAVLAGWLSRRLRRAASTAPAATERPEPAAAMARLLPLLPYGTVLVAAVVPLAAGLYLVTTTAWTILEHLVLRRHQPRR